MTYENLLYSVEERVCVISLNRPEKMNALSWALRNELRDALKAAERDPGRRVHRHQGRGTGVQRGVRPDAGESVAEPAAGGLRVGRR